MSIPTFVAAGTAESSDTTVTPAWPAHIADDVALLIVETANEVASLSDAQGFVEVANSPQGTGTAGLATATRLTVFWKRATGSAMAAPTIADPGNHVVAQIITFRGCETSGNPWNVTAGDVEPTANANVAVPGATTTVTDCLVVAICADARASVALNYSGWANADLSNVTEIIDTRCGAGIGNGGGLGVATGGKATAGAYAATTATLISSANAYQGRLSVALKPPQGAPSVTEGGLWVGTGTKATAGVYSATTATLDTASLQGKMSIALKPPASAPPNLPPILPAVPDLQAFVNTLLEFPLSAVDPEGDLINYTVLPAATSVPAGITIITDEDGGQAFNWTPTGDDVGDWNITLRATDTVGGGFDESTFTITVLDIQPQLLWGAAGSVNLFT